MNVDEDEPEDQDGAAPAVQTRVRSWVFGFVNEMRKKSPATIQKWVDSIAEEGESSKETIEEKTPKCDSNELKAEECSAREENLKVKLNDICNKLSLKSKDLIAKTSQKLKREETLMDSTTARAVNDTSKYDNIPETSNLTVQRSHIGVLGRSSSENPNPRSRRLNDIGRSFSVANENDLSITQQSSENLIYDADEDISITIPSLNRSPSIISYSTNHSLSNSQLVPRASTLLQPRAPREYSASEGHQSPQIQPKNPLLRDASFQSETSSHCSSVESLLEARKPDAESILINLGFGPAHGSDDVVSKIPRRFLKPSQVKGVDTDAFLRNQHLSMHIHENSVLGYRGLLGNSHVPSDIVKAIIERFSANEIQRMSSIESMDCRSPRSFRGVANTILAHRQFMK